jgi:hypothetical protein
LNKERNYALIGKLHDVKSIRGWRTDSTRAFEPSRSKRSENESSDVRQIWRWPTL